MRAHRDKPWRVYLIIGGAIAFLALLLSRQYTEPRPAETPASLGTDEEKAIEASRAPPAIEGEGPGAASPPESPRQWAITLRGVVVDEEYSPVGPEVKVVVRRDALSGVLCETTTDGDGGFKLDLRAPAGPGVLYLEARDGARHGSGMNPCNFFHEGPCEWMVLRLLKMVDVVGRVLDSTGTPVGSRRVLLSSRGTDQTVVSPGYEALSHDYEALTTTDERGEFRATLRAGVEGRFAVLNAGGAPDAPRTFAFANDGDTDLGDLVVSEDAFCTWRLRFVDSQDVAVPGAMVQLYRDSQWTKALHPQLDHETWTILGDSHGELTLQLPCDLGIVESAVGSPRHQSLSLALDCRTPGEREATVRLKDRRRIRVHVRGVDLAELIGIGLTVRAVPDRETKRRARDPRSLDVTTGEEVDLPWKYPNCSRPVDGLEITCSKWEPEATGDGFLVYVGTHGKYELRLRLYQGLLARKTVVVGERDEEVAVELTLPPGRAVRLDCRELNATIRAHSGAWLPRYAAWAEFGGPSAASVGGVNGIPAFLTPGAADASLAGQDDRFLWVSLTRPVVAFGFVEEARSDGIRVFEMTSFEEVDLSQDRPSIAVPVPESRLEAFVPVTIAVTWRGRPFHTAGIPISVGRLDADVPRGEGGLLSRAFVSTDESGTATLRLFPGCYGCQIDPGVRMFPPGNPGSGLYRKRFDVIGSLAPTIQLEIGP